MKTTPYYIRFKTGRVIPVSAFNYSDACIIAVGKMLEEGNLAQLDAYTTEEDTDWMPLQHRVSLIWVSTKPSSVDVPQQFG
jgi:hypothetical protein